MNRDPYKADTSRHADNVIGDFYGNGQCLACGAPESEAPSLLSQLTDQYGDTYFVKQPGTREEIEQACRAIIVCCTDSLRYAGRDPAIILRLGNRIDTCDHPLPGGPVRRSDENDYSWHSLQMRLKHGGQTL